MFYIYLVAFFSMISTLLLLISVLQEKHSIRNQKLVNIKEQTDKSNSSVTPHCNIEHYNLNKIAYEDAKKGNYRPEYVPPVKLSSYKENYKKYRKNTLENKARSDANQQFKYEHGLLSFEPYLQGNGLTHDEEIEIYQRKFIEVKSFLQEQWQMKHKNVNNNNAFNELYSSTSVLKYLTEEEKLDDLYNIRKDQKNSSSHVNIKDFYKSF